MPLRGHNTLMDNKKPPVGVLPLHKLPKVQEAAKALRDAMAQKRAQREAEKVK